MSSDVGHQHEEEDGTQSEGDEEQPSSSSSHPGSATESHNSFQEASKLLPATNLSKSNLQKTLTRSIDRSVAARRGRGEASGGVLCEQAKGEVVWA